MPGQPDDPDQTTPSAVAFQRRIVEAVQTQLREYGNQLTAELEKVRSDLATERRRRAELEQQIAALAGGLEKSHDDNLRARQQLQSANDAKIEGLVTLVDATVESVATISDDVVAAVESRVESRVEGRIAEAEERSKNVENRLAELDAQLADAGPASSAVEDRVVGLDTRLADVVAATAGVQAHAAELDAKLTEAMAATTGADGRLAELGAQVTEVGERSSSVETRLADLETKITEGESSADDRFESRIAGVSAAFGARLDEMSATIETIADADERDQALAALRTDVEQRLGDVENRLAAASDTIATLSTGLEEVRSQLGAVDVEELDELRERMASAAGEAMLVRIDLERFQAKTDEALDASTIRMADLEAQLNAQAMDTEMAMQLERLEEIERALIELDPDQFVRVADIESADDGDDPSITAAVTPVLPDQAHLNDGTS